MKAVAATSATGSWLLDGKGQQAARGSGSGLFYRDRIEVD